MRAGDQTLFKLSVLSLASYFKVQAQRCLTNLPDVNTYFQKVVELRSAMKIAFQMDARQPDVKFVKNFPVWQANRAK